MAHQTARGEDKKKKNISELEAKFERIYMEGFSAGKLNYVPDPIYKEGTEEYKTWMEGWKKGFQESENG